MKEKKAESPTKMRDKNGKQKISSYLLLGLLGIFTLVTFAQANNNPLANKQAMDTENRNQVTQPSTQPQIEPFPTPVPSVKATVFPSVKPTPSIPPTPEPISSESERVNCNYGDRCGGLKETTAVECKTTLCCPIGGQYKIAGINECYQEQNRLLKEAYSQALKDNNQQSLEVLQQLIDKTSEQASILEQQQQDIEETNLRLLEMCRENVNKSYPESINGESPERRAARSAALNLCFNKYGQ